MADSTISNLPALTSPATGDILPIVDVSDKTQSPAGTTKSITKENLTADLATAASLSSHTGNTSNPHTVTKTQVGLGNVDNTSDANKPVSTATSTALSGKSATDHTHTGVYELADTTLQSYKHTHSNKTALDLVSGSNTGDQSVPTTEDIQDIIGAMVTGNTEANITVTYDDATGKLNFSVTAGGTGDVVGPSGATGDHFAVYDGATGKLLKDGGLKISDLQASLGTVGAAGVYGIEETVIGVHGLTAITKTNVGLGNVDNVSQLPASYLDTDVSLAANSNSKVPSQAAVKAYTDGLLAANDAMIYKGVIDCSGTPNYPAASAGHFYKVSVAGKIGGASGVNVEVGDSLLCAVDGTSAGTQAGVGANWSVIQVNIDGAVIGPASVTDSRLAAFDQTTGKLLKDSGKVVGDFATSGHTHAYEPANANIQSHISSTSNPHTVTASQVGAIATGGAYTDLSNATKIGTGSTQVAAGDHNHTGTYKATGADETANVTAASDTAAGKSELATAAETTTGTDTGRTVTPDGLAGSDYGKRSVGVLVFDPATDVATGDGKAFFRIPSILNGYNLVGVAMSVYTAGTTNTTDVQIRNVTDSTDMLSTKLTIDSTEVDTSTAAAAAVIDTTKDDVATGDRIALDVDATSSTKAKGLYVELIFQLP